MAELADALDLGSSAVKGVQVQVLFPAPASRSLGFARDFGSGLPLRLLRRRDSRPLNASRSSPVPGTSLHSRRTRAGSVRLARQAGNRHALIAVVAITAKADANTRGSCGLTL